MQNCLEITRHNSGEDMQYGLRLGEDADLTEKELDMQLVQLMAFEQFLVREFTQIRTQIKSVYSELQSRKEATDLTPDGIPKDVEEHLSEELKKLLSGDQPDGKVE